MAMMGDTMVRYAVLAQGSFESLYSARNETRLSLREINGIWYWLAAKTCPTGNITLTHIIQSG
jgi:hypothetical protein